MFAPRRCRRSQQGAAALEFALVVPLLVMLLLGMTTAGVSLNKALGTTDAIREGARFGGTTPTTPVPVGSSSWSAAIQTKTVELSAGSLTSTAQVCVKLQKGTSTVIQQSACAFSSAEPANPSSLTATDCIVKVWSRIPVTINIGLTSWDVDVFRNAVARYERTCT
jgi:Flp pilus assembly protein TadG